MRRPYVWKILRCFLRPLLQNSHLIIQYWNFLNILYSHIKTFKVVLILGYLKQKLLSKNHSIPQDFRTLLTLQISIWAFLTQDPFSFKEITVASKTMFCSLFDYDMSLATLCATIECNVMINPLALKTTDKTMTILNYFCQKIAFLVCL